MMDRFSTSGILHRFVFWGFVGLAIAQAEVVIRLATAQEAFGLRQIATALCVNATVVGLFAVVAAAAIRFLILAFMGSTTSTGLGSTAPFRMRSIQWGVAAALLFCLTATAAKTSRTYARLKPWASPVGAAGVDDPFAEPNIILIVLDTLRWDHVGVNSGVALTPNIDRLAKSSVVYRHAMSTSSWTLPTHASLFTGLYPSEHGVNWGHYRLDDGPPVLAELLKQRGYHTFAVSNNWLLSRGNGFARGFDFFLETATNPLVSGWRLALRCALPAQIGEWFGMPPEIAYDAGSSWTNVLVSRRLKSLSSDTSPFFCFINYFEPHDPYLPPQPDLDSYLTPAQIKAKKEFRQTQADLCAHACGLTKTFTEDRIDLMTALYNAEVAYQDSMLGRLFNTLEQCGQFDTSWIIVTSDHGELFGESGMVFHTAGAHYKLLHVPLLVRPPGGVEGRIVETPVQPVDVFRTLVSVAGSELPASVTRAFPLPLADDLRGRQLCVSETFGASLTGLSETQSRNMQIDVSQWLHWITSVYSDGFVLELHNGKPHSLYEVQNDPSMENDLLKKLPDVVNRIFVNYQQWLLRPGMRDAT